MFSMPRSNSAGLRLLVSLARAALLVALSVAALGCSTLPFAPTEGPGANLTLATVQHVSERDADLQRAVDAEIEERVAEEVTAARAQDQVRIQELESNLEARSLELADLAAGLERSEAEMAQLAQILTQGLESLAADAAEMRRIALRLDMEIDRLPFETLRELNRAINTHLISSTPVEAKPVASGPPASAE